MCTSWSHPAQLLCLFKAFSPSGLAQSLPDSPPTLEWQARGEASPQEIRAFVTATTDFSHPTSVMIITHAYIHTDS